MPEDPKTLFPAVVAAVVGESAVVINRGSADGLKKGGRFLIYGVGGEIVDPVSNQSLGQLELVRGTGTITHLQEHMATIESDMRTAPTKIRRVRKMPGLMSTIYGDEIEEYASETDTIAFKDVRVGDRVKPV